MDEHLNVPDAELEEDIEQDDSENEYFQDDVLDDNDDSEGKYDDEDDYMFGTNLKKMKECGMKKMLQLKIPLSDGSLAPLFSRGPKYSDKCWPVNCHLCLQGNLLDVKSVRNHLASSTHKKMLKRRRKEPIFYMRAFRQHFCKNPEIATPLRIFPGEIITDVIPRYQHRIIRKQDFQLKMSADEMQIFSDPIADYNETSTLFGLSYAYKMKRYGHLVYFCVLCRKIIPGEAQLHFCGNSHIDEYSEIHFPNTLNRLKIIIKQLNLEWGSFMEAKRIKYLRAIIKLIYTKIEKQYGKQDVELIDAYDFKTHRARYIQKAREADHYNENTIPITDVELKVYVDEVFASNPLPSSPPTKKQQNNAEKFAKPKSLTKELKVQEHQNQQIESKSVLRKKSGRELTSRVSRHYSKEFYDNPNVLDRYSRMIGATLDDLEDQYERYEKNPESHPHYTIEWKKYWHSRADELEKDNIDPHTYNFNSEWMPYWIKRLQELHAKDIVNHKFSIKKRLNMAYDTRSPSPVRRKKRPISPSPRRNRTSQKEIRPDTETTSYQSSDDETLSVISVLRLVTALEDQLGSLGPQAIQLLSRAIISNKNNSNPNDLLMENDCYIFLITVREKFKGQLFARIVESPKINAVNRAVEQITAIVEMFEENKAPNINNVAQNDDDAGVYGTSNQDTDGPSKYRSGDQGGIWQSGAYRGSGYNSGPNNLNLATGLNYRVVDNQTNYQPSIYGLGFHGNCHIDNVDSYSNRASAANEQLVENAITGFRQLNENNGNGFTSNNAGCNNRNYPNNNGLSTFGTANKLTGRSFNQGYNNRGRNIVDPMTSNASFSKAYPMGNNASTNLNSGTDGGQRNTGYNQVNNSNNSFEGQAPDIKLGVNKSSIYSGGNNSGSRINTHGTNSFRQRSMGNFDNSFTSRVNQMNFQNNRNSMY